MTFQIFLPGDYPAEVQGTGKTFNNENWLRFDNMFMTRYQQARSDFEALERIEELSDQVDLDSERLFLMQNPTKLRAARMYESGIHLWFQEHGIVEGTEKIAIRYNIT